MRPPAHNAAPHQFEMNEKVRRRCRPVVACRCRWHTLLTSARFLFHSLECIFTHFPLSQRVGSKPKVVSAPHEIYRFRALAPHHTNATVFYIDAHTRNRQCEENHKQAQHKLVHLLFNVWLNEIFGKPI